jgi:hypothetical protein
MWPHHEDLQHLAIIHMQEDLINQRETHICWTHVDFMEEKKQQIRDWKRRRMSFTWRHASELRSSTHVFSKTWSGSKHRKMHGQHRSAHFLSSTYFCCWTVLSFQNNAAHAPMNLLLMKKHIGSNQGRARMSAFPRPVHRIHMLQDSSIASSMDSSESSWLLYILFSPKLSMLLCRGITQHHREAPNSKLDSSNS